MKKKILTTSLIVAALCAAAAVLVFCFTRPTKFELDDKFLNTSGILRIKLEDFESAMDSKESFVIIVSNDGCFASSTLLSLLDNVSGEQEFSYYLLSWDDFKTTKYHEQVEYAPSILLVRKGEIVEWLDAESGEDTERYHSKEALTEWLKEYIIF